MFVYDVFLIKKILFNSGFILEYVYFYIATALEYLNVKN